MEYFLLKYRYQRIYIHANIRNRPVDHQYADRLQFNSWKDSRYYSNIPAGFFLASAISSTNKDLFAQQKKSF